MLSYTIANERVHFVYLLYNERSLLKYTSYILYYWHSTLQNTTSNHTSLLNLYCTSSTSTLLYLLPLCSSILH